MNTELSKDMERVLEKHFPKGHKDRGAAILLVAVAQVDIRKAVKEERKWLESSCTTCRFFVKENKDCERYDDIKFGQGFYCSNHS